MIGLRFILPAAALVVALGIYFFWMRRQSRPDPHRAERLATFDAENPSIADGYILFLGSSTIERFPLARSFPGKRAVNRGVGNENALDLRARLEQSLPSARPAGIVLYAGSADLRWEASLPAVDVRARVEAIVDALLHRFPGVPVALLEVMSARDLDPTERAALDALTAEWQALAGRRGLTFVRTRRPPLTDETGALRIDVSTDRFHLNERGYTALAAWLVTDGGPVGRLLAP